MTSAGFWAHTGTTSQVAVTTQVSEEAGEGGRPWSLMTGRRGQSGANGDPVEGALVDQLVQHVRAKRWQAAGALLDALQATSEAQAGVVELDAERVKRGR